MMTAAKRFWQAATAEITEAGYAIHLDGRVVKTPAGAVLAVPTRVLAEAIRDEWDSQNEAIDPTTMPMFRFTVTATDRIVPRRAGVIDEISAYGGSDLVCYRGADDARLAARQHETWQPYLDWLAAAEGVRLTVTSGIMPVEQDEAALKAMRAIVARHDDFSLAGLHTLVVVSGSLVIGLAMAHRHVTPEAGFDAALLDDLWQQEKWGYDAEAESHIKARRILLMEAGRFLDMLKRDKEGEGL